MTDQQYELKCGVFHYPSLKTFQLVEFLQNQANQFLHNDLPQYIKTQQKFIAIIESFENNNIVDINFEEYVGILVIYSTSSIQSFQYAKQKISKVLQQNDIFIIIVEMDNSDKQTNTIGDQGQKYCQRNSLPFVRLSLYNSQDLIVAVNKNLYELVQNYYYPNEQEKPSYNNYSQNNKKTNSFSNNDEYILSYDNNQKIIATRDQKYHAQNFLNYASKLRQSREKQMEEEQKVLDQSIDNVEKVLNNINNRIKQKLESNWFTTLKDTLYSPVEKNNQNFSKIKLSQEFIDEKKPKHSSRYYSDHNQSTSSYLNKTSTNLPINFTQLQRQSIMRFVIFLSEENMAQIEVFENSTYQQLGLLALKKLGLKQSDKNLRMMIQKIKFKIQNFVKQLQKGIKSQQQKRIQQRSFLRSKEQSQRDN